MDQARFKSLRSKLITIMVLTLSVVGVSTMGIVAWLSIGSTEKTLQDTERNIRDALSSKGSLLAKDHAMALLNPVIDNGVSDIRSLVVSTVTDDDDVVYGLFLNARKRPWAYISPNHKPSEKKRVDLNAWKELNVPEDQKFTGAVMTREVSLFDQNILEFAMPVIDDEENEVLGTIRYGISTARMKAALRAARVESEESLKRTLTILAVLVVANTFLGLVLVRRQATSITQPIEDLRTAAEKLAGGDRNARVDVQSGDEVQLLGNAFNNMAADLDATYRGLEDLNRTLEDKVDARTAELASRNEDMRVVLDNVQQGLVTVTSDGVLAKERSAVVDQWLGQYGDDVKFADHAGRLDKHFGAYFELGLEGLLEDFLPREVNMMQLPSRLNTGKRTLQIEYVDLSEPDADFAGLLVMMSDISELIARQRAEAEQREIMAIFQRVTADKAGFRSFFGENDRMVKEVTGNALDDDEAVYKRVLHSIKGNCGLCGLGVIASICHELESQIEDSGKLPTPEEREPLRARWRIIAASVREIMGDEEAGSMLDVDHDDFSSLISDLHNKGQDELVERLMAWELEPLSKQFQRIADQARSLSEKLGKGAVVVDVDDGGIRLDTDDWSAFWADFSHVVRNSVDHGLPSSKERESANYAPARITILARAEPGAGFVLEYGDNGKGIDWEAVANKARKAGLPSEQRSDLVEALFHDGLSTREKAGELSGRGVGMSALRSRCELLGGTIEVESEVGKGTLFRFRFPQSAMADALDRRIQRRIGQKTAMKAVS